jgi:hypothetical protein
VAGRLLVAKVNLLMFVEESSWVIRRIAIVQVKTSLSLDSSDCEFGCLQDHPQARPQQSPLAIFHFPLALKLMGLLSSQLVDAAYLRSSPPSVSFLRVALFPFHTTVILLVPWLRRHMIPPLCSTRFRTTLHRTALHPS